jgi:hypothetical protein
MNGNDRIGRRLVRIEIQSMKVHDVRIARNLARHLAAHRRPHTIDRCPASTGASSIAATTCSAPPAVFRDTGARVNATFHHRQTHSKASAAARRQVSPSIGMPRISYQRRPSCGGFVKS